MTFEEMRECIGVWLKGPHGGELWDLMCAQRGPDSPSERDNMGADQRAVAYAARRKRKFNTTEVIRQASWGGVVGGSARSHQGNSITLPPQEEWDHFDKHMARAAEMVGLTIKTAPPPKKGVEVQLADPPPATGQEAQAKTAVKYTIQYYGKTATISSTTMPLPTLPVKAK